MRSSISPLLVTLLAGTECARPYGRLTTLRGGTTCGKEWQVLPLNFAPTSISQTPFAATALAMTSYTSEIVVASAVAVLGIVAYMAVQPGK